MKSHCRRVNIPYKVTTLDITFVFICVCTPKNKFIFMLLQYWRTLNRYVNNAIIIILQKSTITFDINGRDGVGMNT